MPEPEKQTLQQVLSAFYKAGPHVPGEGSCAVTAAIPHSNTFISATRDTGTQLLPFFQHIPGELEGGGRSQRVVFAHREDGYAQTCLGSSFLTDHSKNMDRIRAVWHKVPSKQC